MVVCNLENHEAKFIVGFFKILT